MISLFHHIAAQRSHIRITFSEPPNAPKANPPPKNLPSVVKSGIICRQRTIAVCTNIQDLLPATGGEPRGLHFVEDQQRSALVAQATQTPKEIWIAWYLPSVDVPKAKPRLTHPPAPNMGSINTAATSPA